jgi:hypothetical protein
MGKKYTKTMQILTEIKNYIENKYDVYDCEIVKGTYDEHIYSILKFKLRTPFYDVQIKVNRDYNFKKYMYLHPQFKNPRPQRRGGVITGYAVEIYRADSEAFDNYLKNIKYDKIDQEILKILQNIKEDGTWCDEDRYDE